MNKLLSIVLVLFSLSAIADNKNDRRHRNHKSNPDCIFDVIPLNSPVKESVARFLIKTPEKFYIDEVSYQVKNSGRFFDKPRAYQKINLVEGAEGKELHISVSKLPPGFYQLLVKIKDKSRKEHHFKTKFKDHAMFVIDSSLQVPMPDPKLNDKTVAGIDSDGDGIRDDVQRWINETYSAQPNVKLALKQIAIGKQVELLSVDNKEQSIIASNKVLHNSICLTLIVGIDAKANIEDALYSKMLNNKDRHYANIKSNANFSGQIFELPPRDTRSALCDFDVGTP